MTESEDRLAELIAAVPAETDPGCVEAEARAHHLRLAKPSGSLGRLEDLGVRLAVMAGTAIPPVPAPGTVVVFAGDHGVLAEGVSPWPQEVTAQMVANICAGGAAVNAIASAGGLSVVTVNAGVANEVADHPRLINRPVRRGTGNLAAGPAMTTADAVASVLLGADVGRAVVADGARCLLTGDMGIGNTTPSAAVIAAATGRPPMDAVGRGTGIDDEMLAVKVGVVERALARLDPTVRRDGVALLAEVGGCEIGAIAGLCLAGAVERVPVVVDGVIALAGAVVAGLIHPDVTRWLIAGHLSAEPGATLALDHLALKPLLDLDLRLGEGTGAALAYPIVVAAAKVMNDVATFDSAGVSDDQPDA